MASIDLVFKRPAATDAHLVFGEIDDGGAPPIEVSITGGFKPLTVAIVAARVEQLAITGSFKPLTVSVSAQYASNTARPTVGEVPNHWQIARPTSDGVHAPHFDAHPQPEGWQSTWQRAARLAGGVNHLQPNSLAREHARRASGFQGGARTHAATGFRHQVANAALRVAIADAFEAAARAHAATGFRHQVANRTIRPASTAAFEGARHLGATHVGSFQKAIALFLANLARYQEGVPPPAGLSRTPPEPGQEPCYDPNPHLLFSFPQLFAPHLLFQCGNYSEPVEPPDGEVVIPVQRVYIVTNTVQLRRASDGALIPVLNLSLSIDVDSWTWSFNASLPGAALAQVEPDSNGPIELIASINGTEFLLLAENIGRDRTFGRTSLRVSGRGKNALLDSPYAPVQNFTNSEERTAQQLMADVLTDNGIPLGWSLDFDLEDWLVPARTLSVQGSYIAALNAIAKAAGGYIQPHPSEQILRVLPAYPALPWAWSGVTPNYELPSAVTTLEQMSIVHKPEYTRVYVAGAGGIGQVTRAGTDGTLIAPMVTDPLASAVEARRQRGGAILADTGRQREITLRLPVLPATGIITPGQFVRYTDGPASRLGLVRSVNVETSNPTVWQSLTLETHE